MSYGEFTGWEERLDRALKSQNKLKSLDNIRRDLQEAYDLNDPKYHRELAFYNKIKEHMLDAEVA